MKTRPTNLRLLAMLALVGTVSCTAILGDFEVSPEGAIVPDGGDGTTDAASDVAVDAPRDAAPSGFTGAKQLAAGARHTCALDTKGDIYCWGDNSEGQLARPQALARSATPKKVPLQAAASAIASSGFHTCARVGDELVCWGRNSCGQIGAGDTQNPSPVPRKVTTNPAKQWAFVAPGVDHTCAVDQGGATYCWGCNTQGQAGAIGAGPILTPTNAGAEKNGYSSMAASTGHTCAGLGSGAFCWGTEDMGQLGNGAPPGESSTSALSAGVAGAAKAVAVGEKHSCALDANGNALCWGDNAAGQLGVVLDGAPGTRGPFLAIAAGGATTCAIASQGSRVVCVGNNNHGQLGRGGTADTSPHPMPQVVFAPGAPGTPLTSGEIAVGREHACAVVGPAGQVVCWGNATDGQVGDGTPGGPPRTLPVFVAEPDKLQN